MICRPTALPGVLLLEPQVHSDARGSLYESHQERTFVELGIRVRFVQENHSVSRQGVLRGLHYQLRRPQAKLVRAVAGGIFAAAADVRRGSPDFGRWTAERLSRENRRMLFVPAGFAFGFYVPAGEAEVVYKCSDFYSPPDERGIAWNDPRLAVAWPLAGAPLLSPRDAALPALAVIAPEDLPRYGDEDRGAAE